MNETVTVLLDAMPYVLQGAAVTVIAVVGAMFLGLFIGVPLAVGQVYGPWAVRALCGLYVWFFRGVPILVLLFLFYFGLFNLVGLNLNAVAAATIVLGMTSGAYQSQIFRGSILSLAKGQLKAARALGMSDGLAIRSIILPQALRLSIPGWSNEYSIILKDSALAFVLGASEIMARTHFVASRTYQHLPMYVSAAVLYFLLTWAGVIALRALEKRVRIKGYVH
ncbi:amino acid ABC transporter membrane protein 1, PAAT family [Desulfomicrobium apsheronum]|jgi:polar amino acid transport system permease protein|uniref:Amino acid ABC transporter membrane protein 1, PAAT family n=1 Tax=Desulfomicrobium apsheronum TaxID=52560 RepID=A0A1I3Z405_9BACT|nr:amino acid ABC transporter permease [Desulfomicrobium apsheronum]MDY0228262.1 amino acid ABC transporter permease [Desulfomicrobium apsheronum]SFK38802.1 amino acid ABC transporter membrane protein 1, PAAT family [Desulfomicrobium apsheronum]